MILQTLLEFVVDIILLPLELAFVLLSFFMTLFVGI